jgi:hypothetical protein
MLGNTRLDHPEEPPPRPTDYVIRHILHVSRPNSNVGSEWPKSTRIAQGRQNLVLAHVVALARANFLVGQRINLHADLTSTGPMGVFELRDEMADLHVSAFFESVF